VYKKRDLFPMSSYFELLHSFIHHNHHHRPLISCISGVRATCFLLPFSSITRHLHGCHAHSFPFYVVLHIVHSSFPRLTSTRMPIYIHTTLFVMWLSSLRITCSFQANLLILSSSNFTLLLSKWNILSNSIPRLIVHNFYSSSRIVP
jgi:hypothetical protein